MKIFIAKLFTITKIWQQPKCLVTEIIRYIHKMEYYSVLGKGNSIICKVWMNLEDIILILICMNACSFSHVQLFATPWTVAHQDPLSMKFSRQEY